MHFFNLSVFLLWEGSFMELTIHVFFTWIEVGLDIEVISKSTDLELKVSLFDKTLKRDICCVFSYKLSFCNMSDVTNVKSEPVSNIALVQMDFHPFETMTEIICKYVLGEIVLEWDVWIL